MPDTDISIDSTLSISPIAFERFKALQAERGSQLSDNAADAISSLLQTLEEGLKGKLNSHFFLSSVDPGIGKTTAVCEFLKAWKEIGYLPDSSVIIGLSRKVEIEEYIRYASLNQNEVAVLTTDDAVNQLGLSVEEHGSARVMFTTQQMLLSRSRLRDFREASEFFYLGRSRTLRVWDETILPAKPVVIRRDQLLALPETMRPAFPNLVAPLALFTAELRTKKRGEVMSVPEALIRTLPTSRELRGAGAILSDEAARTVDDLGLAGNNDLLVVNGGESFGLALAGASRSLPDDFAPAIVLDASGRVRETYRLWKEHRGNLVRLPEVANDYRDLTISVWETACGKKAFQTPGTRSKLVSAVAEVINEKPETRWLVIHYKTFGEQFMASLRSTVTNGTSRIESLTWGMHHGTNAYRDIENVVIIGAPTYRSMDYEAHVLAASGLPVGQLSNADVRALKRGEYQHHLLQAVCRSATRKSRNGIAGRCRVYVTVAPHSGLEALLRMTFPGANMRWWRGEEDSGALNGKKKAAATYLLERFADPGTISVRKTEVVSAIGMSSPSSFANNVVRHADFQQFLSDNDLASSHGLFERLALEPDTLDEFDLPEADVGCGVSIRRVTPCR